MTSTRCHLARSLLVPLGTILSLASCSHDAPEPSPDHGAPAADSAVDSAADGSVASDSSAGSDAQPDSDGSVTPPANPVFASDWSHGLGTDPLVLRDGGKWTDHANYGGSSNLLSVVQSTGLGFPAQMKNVLRVAFQGWGSHDVKAHNEWSRPPQPGDALYFRVYLRNDVDPNQYLAFGGHHPLQLDKFEGAEAWMDETYLQNNPQHRCYSYFQIVFGGDLNDQGQTDGRFGLAIKTDNYDWPKRYWGVALNLNEAHRIEWGFVKVAQGSYQIKLRTYGQDGTLLADSDLGDVDGGNAQTLLKDQVFEVPDRCLEHLMLGENGPPAASNPDEGEFYWAGFAVCQNQWCGPY